MGDMLLTYNTPIGDAFERKYKACFSSKVSS